MSLPNRRPVKLDDLTPPRWTDRYPSLGPRIVVNRLRALVQRHIDTSADLVARLDAVEQRQREREREARRARLRR